MGLCKNRTIVIAVGCESIKEANVLNPMTSPTSEGDQFHHNTVSVILTPEITNTIRQFC